MNYQTITLSYYHTIIMLDYCTIMYYHTTNIGFPENEASVVRRWLHYLEPMSYMENLGHTDHCAYFPQTQSRRTYAEDEMLRIRGRLLSASSQAARLLELTAVALAMEWTLRTPRLAQFQIRTSTSTTAFFGAGRSTRPKQLGEPRVWDLSPGLILQ